MRKVVTWSSLLVVLALAITPACAADAKPDFVVLSFGTIDTFLVWFEVRNESDKAYAGPLWCKIWDKETLVEEWATKVSLPGKSSMRITSNYSLAARSGWASGKVKVEVDSKKMISELNEDNNTSTTWLTVPLIVTAITPGSVKKNFKLFKHSNRNEKIRLPFTFHRVAGNLDQKDLMLPYTVLDTQFGTKAEPKRAAAGANLGYTTFDSFYEFVAQSEVMDPLTPAEYDFELQIKVQGQRELSATIPYHVTVHDGFVKKTGNTYATITMGSPKIPVGQKACPFFYLPSPDGATFVKHGEIIRNLVGPASQMLERTVIAPPVVQDGVVSLLIREEKDEVSFLDYVALEVDGHVIAPLAAGSAQAALCARDRDYLILERGEEVRLDFVVGEGAVIGEAAILADGYYE